MLVKTCLESSLWFRWQRDLSPHILKECVQMILLYSIRFLCIFVQLHSFTLPVSFIDP